MKERRFDWFMFTIVLSLMLLGPILLYFGAKDNEDEVLRRMERCDSVKSDILTIDSLRRAQRAMIDKRREDSLVTKDDSIHHFEDGF